MTKPNPFEAIEHIVALSSRDMSLSNDDAALYAIVFDWQAVQQAEHSGLAKLLPLCVARGLSPGSILTGWPCGVEPLVGRYLGTPARRDAKGRRTKGPGVSRPGARWPSPKGETPATAGIEPSALMLTGPIRSVHDSNRR